jgi:hypothetical protein
MTKGDLKWFSWYVQAVSVGARLAPETHALAQAKIDADIERLARRASAMAKGRERQLGRRLAIGRKRVPPAAWAP